MDFAGEEQEERVGGRAGDREGGAGRGSEYVKTLGILEHVQPIPRGSLQ